MPELFVSSPSSLKETPSRKDVQVIWTHVKKQQQEQQVSYRVSWKWLTDTFGFYQAMTGDPIPQNYEIVVNPPAINFCSTQMRVLYEMIQIPSYAKYIAENNQDLELFTGICALIAYLGLRNKELTELLETSAARRLKEVTLQLKDIIELSMEELHSLYCLASWQKKVKWNDLITSAKDIADDVATTKGSKLFTSYMNMIEQQKWSSWSPFFLSEVNILLVRSNQLSLLPDIDVFYYPFLPKSWVRNKEEIKLESWIPFARNESIWRLNTASVHIAGGYALSALTKPEYNKQTERSRESMDIDLWIVGRLFQDRKQLLINILYVFSYAFPNTLFAARGSVVYIIIPGAPRNIQLIYTSALTITEVITMFDFTNIQCSIDLSTMTAVSTIDAMISSKDMIARHTGQYVPNQSHMNKRILKVLERGFAVLLPDGTKISSAKEFASTTIISPADEWAAFNNYVLYPANDKKNEMRIKYLCSMCFKTPYVSTNVDEILDGLTYQPINNTKQDWRLISGDSSFMTSTLHIKDMNKIWKTVLETQFTLIINQTTINCKKRETFSDHDFVAIQNPVQFPLEDIKCSSSRTNSKMKFRMLVPNGPSDTFLQKLDVRLQSIVKKLDASFDLSLFTPSTHLFVTYPQHDTRSVVLESKVTGRSRTIRMSSLPLDLEIEKAEFRFIGFSVYGKVWYPIFVIEKLLVVKDAF